MQKMSHLWLFSTDIFRKIGWCHWKGAWRKAVNEECEDGYKEEEE